MFVDLKLQQYLQSILQKHQVKQKACKEQEQKKLGHLASSLVGWWDLAPYHLCHLGSLLRHLLNHCMLALSLHLQQYIHLLKSVLYNTYTHVSQDDLYFSITAKRDNVY